jgi:hypothetical protein
LDDNGAMLDAGYAKIFLNVDDLSTIAFSNQSRNFGRADDRGRQETCDIARTLLGEDVQVITV